MRLVAAPAVVAVLALTGACTGSSGDQAGSTTEATAPTPSFVGDGSSFCDAMLGVGRVGGSAAATPEQTLRDNEELAALLDEAQVNTPEDAPRDFDVLLDDYRAASQAIATAGGDTEAAFAKLAEESPAVVRRLGSADSHAAAYDFLVERCGIERP